MAEYIELIDKYRIIQSKDTDYNPPSYEWVDNTGEIVRCKDCVYWQKPQVKLNDGTYRDYDLGEYENGSLFGGVTLDVGINIGSFCAKYNTEHQNRIPQFMGENDFCSKGYKLREEH